MLVSSVSINASEADNYEAAQSTDVAVTYYACTPYPACEVEQSEKTAYQEILDLIAPVPASETDLESESDES